MFKNLSPGAIGISADMKTGLILAKKFGFEGLDINIHEAKTMADEQSIDEVKALWEGVKMGAWSFPLTWNAPEDEYKGSLARLPDIAAFAAELGCYRTSIAIPPASNDKTYRENWDFHVTRFRSIGEILADHGHVLGLEFIGPRTSRAKAKHGFVYTMDGMRGLAAAIGTGNIGLLLDTWHWYTAQSTLSDLAHLHSEDVVYVHVNDAPSGIAVEDQIDNMRCLPAETGVIPLGEFFKILAEVGYDGPVAVEPFSQKLREMKPDKALQTTIDSLDAVWAKAGLS
mgnify:FL=1